MQPRPKTSWQGVSRWYNDSVGEEGHYYHQHLIIPGVIRLLKLTKGNALLDLGCGQGVLERHLPSNVEYLGLDASHSLVKAAIKQLRDSKHQFKVADITKPQAFGTSFTHAAIILALQNVDKPENVLRNAAHGLVQGGQLLIVINHPCFRIPRQSSWKVDEQQKLQYRRIDRYMSTMEIPIHMNPGSAKNEKTLSFHYPLSAYFQMLHTAGFVVENMEEWCSNKESTGKAAKMENRARTEFPLFMTLSCRRLT